MYSSPTGFNPRAPCGARRAEAEAVSPPPDVSIHAPRAGRDYISWISWPSLICSNPRAPCGARRLFQALIEGAASFNPRAPCGARPKFYKNKPGNEEFQSTRPVRGATAAQASRGSTPSRFNPRAPCGARHARGYPERSLWDVSIHAPRAGRDQGSPPAAPPAAGFNPRAPCGARHQRVNLAELAVRFQSTRPVRGATRGGEAVVGLRRVSIHAPRAGRDRLGGRGILAPIVSIHAPRAGRDGLGGAGGGGCGGFNPRAPCGARRGDMRPQVPLAPFQSTRPVRGATCRPSWRRWRRRCFNPRAPCGARPAIYGEANLLSAFQSTRPVRGATVGFDREAGVVGVSIHAPRAGRDLRSPLIVGGRGGFNPRAPCGARQRPNAARTARTPFQSTRPVRGATKPHWKKRWIS